MMVGVRVGRWGEHMDVYLGKFLVNRHTVWTECSPSMMEDLQEAYWYYCDQWCTPFLKSPERPQQFMSALWNHARRVWFPKMPVWNEALMYKGLLLKHQATIDTCGVALRCGEQVLLVEAAPNKWSFPKGKRCRNETAQECALRELCEETGVSLDRGDLLLEEPPLTIMYKSQQKVTLFSATLSLAQRHGLKMKPQSVEVKSVDWVRLDDIRSGKIHLCQRDAVLFNKFTQRQMETESGPLMGTRYNKPPACASG